MKSLIAFGLIFSFSALATETCSLKDKTKYHPDGTPSVRVAVDCTDQNIQAILFSKYDSSRIGLTNMFGKEVKREMIKDIKAAGYIEVKRGMFVK